jgi:hypothetical protein
MLRAERMRNVSLSIRGVGIVRIRANEDGLRRIRDRFARHGYVTRVTR